MINYKWFTTEIIKYRYLYVLMILILGFGSFFSMLQPKVIGNIFDIGMVSKDINYLFFNIFLLSSLGILTSLFFLIANYICSIIIVKFSFNIKILLNSKTFGLRGNNIQADAGKIFTCITSDVGNLEIFFSKYFSDFILSFLEFFIGIYIISDISLIFVFGVIFIYPILFFIQKIINKKSENMFKEILIIKDKSNLLSKELISYLYELIVLGANNYYMNRYKDIEKKLNKETLNFRLLRELNTLLISITDIIILIFILIIGSYYVLEQKISIGEFIVLFMYYRKLFSPVIKMFLVFSEIPKFKISLKRINDIVNF